MLLPAGFVYLIHRAHATGNADPLDLAMDFVKALGISVLLLALYAAGLWLVREKRGYIMLPFLDATKDGFDGQAVSEALAAELQQVRWIHQRMDDANQEADDSTAGAQPSVSALRLDTSPVDTADRRVATARTLTAKPVDIPKPSKVSQISTPPVQAQADIGEIATLKVGDHAFSLGKLFRDLKVLLQTADPKGVFGGSIERHGQTVRVIVSLRESGVQERCWFADRTIPGTEGREQFIDLIRELAFRIFRDVEESGDRGNDSSSWNTWTGLMHYTDAIGHWLDYLASLSPKSLEASWQSCEKSLGAEPTHRATFSLLVTLAREYLDGGDASLSATLCRKALESPKLSPSYRSRALLLLGDAEEQLRKLLSAEQCYRLALVNAPESDDAWQRLAFLLAVTDRADEAADCVRRLCQVRKIEKPSDIGDLLWQFRLAKSAEEQYRAAALADPGDTRPLLQLAELLADTGRAEESIASYEAVLELESPKRAGTFNDLGIVYAESGKAEEAMRCYRQAIELDGQLAAPYLNLGRIYLDRGDAATARNEFLKSIARDPAMGWAWLNLGFACYGMKTKEDAEEAFELGLRLGADRWDVRYTLGEILLDKGDVERAITELARAAEAVPDWSEPHRLLGYAYRQSGNLRTALREFKAALQLDPENKDVHRGLGGTLRAMDRFSEAAEYYERAIQIDPQDAYGHISLSVCYQNEGKLELAEKMKARALELVDAASDTTYNLACFWALAGESGRALELLRSEAMRSETGARLMARSDIDLLSLRDQPEFQAWITEQDELSDVAAPALEAKSAAAAES